jgi:O-antigen ligase
MVIAFYGFLLVALNWIVGWNIYDLTLMPRLLALMVFLALTVPVFAFSRASKKFDAAVLRDPLVLCFGGYVVVTAGSLAFALNPTAGLTDAFKSFGAFAVLCLSCLILPTIPNWPVLLSRIVTLAALGSSGLGFYQITSKFGFGFPTRGEAEAVTGLMSNVNLYAGFLNMLLPFCLCGLFIQRGPWRAVCGVASASTILLIVLLQSRAAYISLVAGLVVVCAILCLFRKSFGLVFSKRTLLALAAGVCALVVMAGVAFASDNPVSQRLRTIFTSDFSAIDGGRLMIWGITLEMIRDYFATGVGAGNFTIRLHEYFDRPGLDFSGKILNWAQPHNDFLWVFAEKGVLGFLLFAAVFVLAILHAIAALRAPCKRDVAWMTAFALMGLTAYIGASCFDFPLERINQQVYLAVLLSILVVAPRPPSPAKQKKSVPHWILAACAIAILVAGTVYSIAAIKQENLINYTRHWIKTGNFPAAIAYARQARTLWKTLDPVATPLSFLEGYAVLKTGDARSAIPLFELARRENPNRLYILQNLADAYLAAGRKADAIECLELATRRYPQDAPTKAALERASAAQ